MPDVSLPSTSSASSHRMSSDSFFMLVLVMRDAFIILDISRYDSIVLMMAISRLVDPTITEM